jgi:hypothetical protein
VILDVFLVTAQRLTPLSTLKKVRRTATSHIDADGAYVANNDGAVRTIHNNGIIFSPLEDNAMTIERTTVLRGSAFVALLLSAPIAMSRAGVRMNDAQCENGLTTCCVQANAECCAGDVDTCENNRYDNGIGKCP